MTRLRLLALAALGFLAGPPLHAQEITGNHRMFERFVEDGALVRQGWFEARATWADWSCGRDLQGDVLLAFRPFDPIELGGRFGYLDRSRSRGEVLFGERLTATDSNNGWTDVDLFAKVRLLEGPWSMSLGAVVKAPVADERERLGSGSTDYEGFFAVRRTRDRLAWVAHGGVRSNGEAKTPLPADGRTSLLLGGGFLVRFAYSWTFQVEAAYESRRYDGGDPDLRVIPAFDLRPTENLALRWAIGGGLSDGAPHREARFGAVFQF